MRREHKGTIDSLKSEYDKNVKEIKKMEEKVKEERLMEKTVDPDFENINNKNNDKRKYMANKINTTTDTLRSAIVMSSEAIRNQERTTEEIIRQNGVLRETNMKVDEVYQELSLHDQIFGVMANRELFNKMKLVFVIALLFVADLIVLYIKL